MEFTEVEGRVLRYLEQRYLAGGVQRAVSPEDISRDNGLEQIESRRLVARLKTLDVLETISHDGDCWINDAICQRVAELDQPPSTPTINVLNIGHVSHSQIQQGSVGSKQTSSHSDVADDVVLSVGASTLLLAAGKTGQIIVFLDTAGLQVQAGGKQFGASFADPRRSAQVESELNELASNGLITAQGEVRSVTARGYQWIDAEHSN